MDARAGGAGEAHLIDPEKAPQAVPLEPVLSLLANGCVVDQPVLTVGRQITRELYLETVYHHNAPPTDNLRELRMEYLITPRFSLDTAYSDAAIGNVDVAWKGRFGGVPPAKPRSSLLAEELAPAPASAPPTVSP